MDLETLGFLPVTLALTRTFPPDASITGMMEKAISDAPPGQRRQLILI
jgi:hypothetical protein